MSIQEIRVGLKDGPDIKGDSLRRELKESLGIKVENVQTGTVYRFEGISKQEADRLRRHALTDPITQRSSVNDPLFKDNIHVLEIGYKPGVMNPVEASLFDIAGYLGIAPLAVSQSIEYAFWGDLTSEQLARIGQHLVSQVEQVITKKPDTLILGSKPGPVELVTVLDLDEDGLAKLSNKRRLFLNVQEMTVIQRYFQGLGREPTDVEIESLAQTWSEHCGHKTFKAQLYAEDGKEKSPLIKRIKETSCRYFERVGVVTAFADNAGGIKFYDGYVIIAKGETHNSPVAVEPDGGAETKVGGVIRDISGCGLGGKNLLLIDVNNFAPPDTNPDEIPPGCLHPKYLLLENSRGERDYGNRMGIPTHAVSIHFHPDFAPKPTSLGVVFGIIPEERVQKGNPEPGDLIITVGGKTGRDGIHGATFSSGAMTKATKTVDATAVQIGNAIEEKRMFDALLACRDANLIRAITDCGGGGYSSSIGEIGKEVGVEVDLETVPQKYAGLTPWEIWLSESQERMIVALDPKNWEEFARICRLYNTPCDVIGRFTGDRIMTLKHDGKIVANLSMQFLHDGLPQREMKLKYTPYPEDGSTPEIPSDWLETYKKVMAHLNVSSFEEMLRLYDQTVQGTTVLHPYTGVYQDAPNDATIVAPIYGKDYGMVTAFGLNPILNRIDPYWGSVWAATEAVSNFTAVGGNVNEAAMIDNFIWPFPDEESLGDLDKSVDALCHMMDTLQIPCVSGKDSLSSTYIGDGKVIKIPPVLNISVFGKIPDVRKTTSVDIKSTNSVLYLVGNMDIENMGGSVYFDTKGVNNSHVPKVNINELPKVLEKVHAAIQTGEVRSCHDIGEGGLAVTLAEMCFGGDCGADVDISGLNASRPDFAFFNETAGCFVVEIGSIEKANELFANVPRAVLGKTKKEKDITVTNSGQQLLKADLYELKQIWQRNMKEVIS